MKRTVIALIAITFVLISIEATPTLSFNGPGQPPLCFPGSPQCPIQ